MSMIRRLLGLSFLKIEPWRFPENRSDRSGMVIGNTRVLRRENTPGRSSFEITKEIIGEANTSKTKFDVEDLGDEVPLHVKLKETQKINKTSRRRNMTRVSGASGTNKLSNVLSLTGNITPEQALSVGYAAVELGIRYLRIDSPSSKTAVEQLRIIRTITSRLNLLLMIKVSSPEELNFCSSWADVIEIEILKDPTKRELVRCAINSGKILALKRGLGLSLPDFLYAISKIQLEITKEIIIVEGVSGGQAPSFNVGIIQILREKTGASVILDLSDVGVGTYLNLQLSAVASGASGLILPFEHKDATESFEKLQLVFQKLNAMKYTLDAIAQIA